MRSVLSLLFVAAAFVMAPMSLRAQMPAKPTPPTEPTIASGGEVAATTAVEVWVGMVDDGRYRDSWQLAASLFKKAVTQEKWVEMLTTYRQPLGKLLARHVKSKQFTRTGPGVPDGQYVVFQYDTSFENKKTAVELITSVLDVDGQWRVTGYYIR